MGSALRELASPLLPAPWFWVPTLLVNVAACFGIGWLYARRDSLHPHLMHLAAIGFLGGLSTFSHFTQEIARLIDTGNFAEALGYPAMAITLGLLAAFAGESLSARRS